MGGLQNFSKLFEEPILKGLFKNASALQKETAFELQKQLLTRLRPHFLRREKKQLFSCGREESSDQSRRLTLSISPSHLLASKLNDFVIYLPLTATQKKLYVEFLKTDPLKQILAHDRGKNSSFFPPHFVLILRRF